ncbi:MAG: glycine cleavage system aminomethyltransferase GcvT, partial [Chloroflexia bacterium]
MTDDLKQTPLYEAHRALGARTAPFSGWVMPIQYSGLIEEHRAVRSNAGLFDLSHMGEFEIRGSGAFEFLNHSLTNDAAAL